MVEKFGGKDSSRVWMMARFQDLPRLGPKKVEKTAEEVSENREGILFKGVPFQNGGRCRFGCASKPKGEQRQPRIDSGKTGLKNKSPVSKPEAQTTKGEAGLPFAHSDHDHLCWGAISPGKRGRGQWRKGGGGRAWQEGFGTGNGGGVLIFLPLAVFRFFGSIYPSQPTNHQPNPSSPSPLPLFPFLSAYTEPLPINSTYFILTQQIQKIKVE